MDIENGRKPGVSSTKPETKGLLLMLRMVAFCATASATVVMALNKETKTVVVATIGNTPIKVTLTAKFQHTPAFVFFVIANGMASLHSLLMILVDLFGKSFDYKGLKLFMIAILDMMTVALVAGAANAAAFMAELGKNGNSHARWNKICDKFDEFCNHGGGAIIGSFVGILLLLIISAMSIIRPIKPASSVQHCSPAV
ncbi:CASP-like protein 1B2 [Tripterygium wilfordii]|uniref:CASP-like protein n=1 Tax=Tripterygium wilfordii TaxID=458696 RepID=A0A7J7D8M1_TRIWF|nr:CASP-like protein 1B2 [Tripterygium wilfordii]KAF5742406.1 CASP-like protein 1B2 [Tripterygium wilfordii]